MSRATRLDRIRNAGQKERRFANGYEVGDQHAQIIFRIPNAQSPEGCSPPTFDIIVLLHHVPVRHPSREAIASAAAARWFGRNRTGDVIEVRLLSPGEAQALIDEV